VHFASALQRRAFPLCSVCLGFNFQTLKALKAEVEV
jgi:hypothetical protein